MSERKWRARWTILIPILLVLSFQNCGKRFEASSYDTLALQLQSSLGACQFDGQLVPEGNAVTAFVTSTVPAGQKCVAETRVCTSGQLSGSALYGSCAPGAAQACLFAGKTIVDGQSVPAFQTATVPYNQSCVTENRTCANGTLSGSFTFATCTKLPAPAVKRISAGYGEACVLIGDKIKCWGDDNQKTLFIEGLHRYGTPAQPTTVATGASDFSVKSFNFECHLQSGAVTCTGQNLGLYTDATNTTLVPMKSTVLVSSGAKLVDASTYSACVATQENKLLCWLYTQKGFLPAVEINLDHAPVQALALSGRNSCAILEGGSVKCWVMFYNGSANITLMAPVQMVASGATSISSDQSGNTCAVINSDLYCWSVDTTVSFNAWASGFSLPDGTQAASLTPVLVQKGVSDVSMAANGGQMFTCVVRSDTSVQCWGGIPAATQTILPAGAAKVARMTETPAASMAVQMTDGTVLGFYQNPATFQWEFQKVNLD